MALNTYIEGYLGATGTFFGWTSGAGSYAAAVTRSLDLYGVATEGLATDLVKLHALANIAAWEQVIAGALTMYDFSADGGSYKPSQIYDHAVEQYKLAFADGCQYLSNYSIETGTWNDAKFDPYSSVPYYDRAV